MTWTFEGVIDQSGRFEILEPEEILYELENPKIFTSKDGGELVLVYESFVNLSESCINYIVTPTSSSIINALKDGAKSVIQALDQPWVWIVVQNFDGEFKQSFLLKNGIHSVPDGYKPKKSAMLWPELMPLVSVRLIGKGLREGHIPSSVIKRAAESFPGALKKCFGQAFGATGLGRPDDSVRNLYDLEAQQMAFNSFEISFRAADQSQLTIDQGSGFNVYAEHGLALRKAIGWAKDEANAAVPSVDVVEALEKLVPPMHGVVEEVEVRGTIFQESKSFVLNRSTTKKVKHYLTERRASERSFVNTAGSIDEIDKGRLTFILRGTTGGIDQNFVFADEFLDDIIMAFVEGVKVSVSGRKTSSKKPIELLGLDLLETPTNDIA